MYAEPEPGNGHKFKRWLYIYIYIDRYEWHGALGTPYFKVI